MSTKPTFRTAAKRCSVLLVACLFLTTSVIVAIPQRAAADVAAGKVAQNWNTYV